MRTLLLIVLFIGTVTGIAWLTVHFSTQGKPISLSPDAASGEVLTPEEIAAVAISAPTPPPKADPIVLLFGGDVMLDRHIRQKAAVAGYSPILADFLELTAKVDAVVVNLEGPISDFPSRSIGSAVGSPNNFLFTFEPAVTGFLKEYNISIVNLGNNHILNFGASGLKQTYENLDRAGIEHFGFVGASERPSTLITTIKEVRFGFVNYNQFLPGGYEQALADIAKVRPEVAVVIVHPHWGLEYKPTANQVIRNQAHAFIDAGADLIIGAHPHVVQQSEVYQGKTIYYSLGNFVFDQYFEEAVRSGKLVEATFDPETLEPSFVEFNTWLEKDGTTSLKL
jgi:poly-gamma-glutamate capsule biosynthesis protein CapA/YwtB (metallophosphatase superfamily)